MNKNKECNISMNADIFLDDYLWQATRYCVGRRSYVSTMGYDYAKLIHKNLNEFNSERLEFYARDILENVADSIKYYDNIHIDNAYNNSIKTDPITLILKYIKENNISSNDIDKWKFDVDCTYNTVKGTLYNGEKQVSLLFNQHEIVHLISWVDLANSLINIYKVDLTNGDTYYVVKSINYVYSNSNNLEFVYRNIENMNSSTYINPVYIKEITYIGNVGNIK